MIRHVRDLSHDEALWADVGVVGSGFAGLELATFLARNGLRVVVLEGGDLRFEPETQALNRIESTGKAIRVPDPDGGVTPYLDPVFRGETRIRQFGGTSNIWTGKWRIFDQLDFEERAWVPHSGWPIGLDELLPWYEAIAGDYGLADFACYGRSAAIARLRDALAPAGMTVSYHYWDREPVRPARRFRAEIEESTDLTVVLGANATEIVLDDDLRRVTEVVFRSLDGYEGRLSADRFVLATGGLESARLLLASNRQLPDGIGNAKDLVGRFYMDHPKHKRGILHVGPAFGLVGKRAVSSPRPRFIVSFSLTEARQRDRALANHAIYFAPKYRYERNYPGKHVQAIRDARVKGVRHAVRPALAILRSPRALASMVAHLVYRRRGGPIAHCTCSMYLEQVPNRDSRVFLGGELDALGVPKLVVDWRLTDEEREGFDRILEDLVAACSASGLGRLEFGSLALDDTVDAAHHIGATRMAARPDEGVVDSDLKVFGTENLFVASSAVFPTGHTVGPTFTILALSRRLGAHLVDLARRPSPLVRERGLPGLEPTPGRR